MGLFCFSLQSYCQILKNDTENNCWKCFCVYIILSQLLLQFSTFLCLFKNRFNWAPTFVTVLLINDIDSNTNKYMIYSTHRFRKFFRWLLKTTSLHIIFVKHVALFFLFKLFRQRVGSVVTRWKLDFIHVIYRHG